MATLDRPYLVLATLAGVLVLVLYGHPLMIGLALGACVTIGLLVHGALVDQLIREWARRHLASGAVSNTNDLLHDEKRSYVFYTLYRYGFVTCTLLLLVIACVVINGLGFALTPWVVFGVVFLALLHAAWLARDVLRSVPKPEDT
jgi:hypothetical protein